MGLFHEFLDDKEVEMIAVEAAGLGINSGKHAASLTGGKPGILHGNKTYLLPFSIKHVLSLPSPTSVPCEIRASNTADHLRKQKLQTNS